jgi:hypothetical protein
MPAAAKFRRGVEDRRAPQKGGPQLESENGRGRRGLRVAHHLVHPAHDLRHRIAFRDCLILEPVAGFFVESVPHLISEFTFPRRVRRDRVHVAHHRCVVDKVRRVIDVTGQHAQGQHWRQAVARHTILRHTVSRLGRAEHSRILGRHDVVFAKSARRVIDFRIKCQRVVTAFEVYHVAVARLPGAACRSDLGNVTIINVLRRFLQRLVKRVDGVPRLLHAVEFALREMTGNLLELVVGEIVAVFERRYIALVARVHHGRNQHLAGPLAPACFPHGIGQRQFGDVKMRRSVLLVDPLDGGSDIFHGFRERIPHLDPRIGLLRLRIQNTIVKIGHHPVLEMVNDAGNELHLHNAAFHPVRGPQLDIAK